MHDEAGYTTATYGDAFADVYDEWYGAISDLDGTVDSILELAGGRRVLELGVGTGRIALPLARRGSSITGIDASAAMLAVLRTKPDSEAVEVLEGDMSELPDVPPSAFGVAFATFNTLFNLPSEAAQRRCFERVAQVLEPGGHFVVEAFLPSDPPATPEGRLDVRAVEVDRVHLTATWREPHSQTVRGQHIELSAAGTRLRPWLLRYASPEQLDALAADVGLELSTRHGGWRGEPFDPLGTRHVSIYRRRPRTGETP